ncbi:MAG: UDP-N-acetylglucosamine 2-epimerase (hydrolyzing) [Thermoplasmatales archaeon]|nr:UDP-N-acetylglucosamine 2-epimerase (hydrolyzing) [Thermoplasmatales archaeon]MCK4996123.1 UDP-N-acetylglucosamine 2-epimerase (hydrolyzing) [Thermoplasmatales archaeon]
MKRKICVVTGTRAEYGLLKQIMNEIKKKPDLQLQLIVTGMHLMPEYGHTKNDVKKDGFKIDAEVDMTVEGDNLSDMAESVGKGITGMNREFKRLKPDVLLILGDRTEPFAAAITASIMNIPIAHIGGGQVSGCIDNHIRNTISKLAHIHFVRNPLHAEKLKEIGEEKWRIHTTGTLCLDAIMNMKTLKPEEISKKYLLDFNQPILLAVFHPDTLDIEKSIIHTKNLCDALVELDMQTVFIYPNADAGGRRILKIIKECTKHPKIKLYKNLPQDEYYSIMKKSSLMIGNSSSGIIEAPALGLPAINIGNRQKGRDRLENVIDIDGETDQMIKSTKKLLKSASKKKYDGVYGDGKTAEKIVEILSKVEISDKLMDKK